MSQDATPAPTVTRRVKAELDGLVLVPRGRAHPFLYRLAARVQAQLPVLRGYPRGDTRWYLLAGLPSLAGKDSLIYQRFLERQAGLARSG